MSPGQSRVELPREETRGRQQDLVGPLELTNLPLQLPQPGGIGGRHPRSATGVDVGLLAPTAQRIDIDPHPRPDPVHRRRHRQLRLFLARLGDQANRPLPQLIRVLPRCWHGPVLVGSEPPLNPGRFTSTSRPGSRPPPDDCACTYPPTGPGSRTGQRSTGPYSPTREPPRPEQRPTTPTTEDHPWKSRADRRLPHTRSSPRPPHPRSPGAAPVHRWIEAKQATPSITPKPTSPGDSYWPCLAGYAGTRLVEALSGETPAVAPGGRPRRGRGGLRQIAFTVGGEDTAGRNYLTWAAVEGTARLVDAPAADPVTVSLGTAEGNGGRLEFSASRDGTRTGSLELSLPADGTPVSFWVAGAFGQPSSAD